MPIRVAFETEGPILKARVSGSRPPGKTVEAAQEFCRLVIEQLKKEPRHLILAAFDVEGPKTYFEAYHIFHDPDRYAALGKEAIAFVYHNPAYRAEDKFGETVARNRNWNLMIFCNEAEAVTWLKSQAVPAQS